MHLGHQQYTTNKALTATRGELVVLLYDTCLKSLRLARHGMETKTEIAVTHEALLKAQRAVEELQLSLDLRYGELPNNLYALYEFMIHELVLANVHKDPVRIDNVIRLLEELAEAWREVAKLAVDPPMVRSA